VKLGRWITDWRKKKIC